jgi:hypothetical protein
MRRKRRNRDAFLCTHIPAEPRTRRSHTHSTHPPTHPPNHPPTHPHTQLYSYTAIWLSQSPGARRSHTHCGCGWVGAFVSRGPSLTHPHPHPHPQISVRVCVCTCGCVRACVCVRVPGRVAPPSLGRARRGARAHGGGGVLNRTPRAHGGGGVLNRTQSRRRRGQAPLAAARRAQGAAAGRGGRGRGGLVSVYAREWNGWEVGWLAPGLVREQLRAKATTAAAAAAAAAGREGRGSRAQVMP